MSDTVTETIDPAASLTDPLAGVVPSTVTAPAANAPTSDRETGDHRHHPVEPLAVEGCRHLLLVDRHVRVPAVRRRPAGRPDHHTHVGDVEHRPPLQVDEVDHRTVEEPLVAPERPVHQVADRAAADQARRHRTSGAAAGAAQRQRQHHAQRDHGDPRADAPTAAEAERRPRVVGELEPQRPDHVHDAATVEVGHRPGLGELIGRQDRQGDRGEQLQLARRHRLGAGRRLTDWRRTG
jgi:hypothetical protein